MLSPARLAPAEPSAPSAPAAATGGRCWLWQGRFGTMRIEVIGDEVYVDGERVEPAASQVPAPASSAPAPPPTR